VVKSGEKFTPSVERSILKPVSLLELSSHVRSICEVDEALAANPEGAAGRTIVAAVLLYPESPPPLVARTRYV
jgi:hypothetical protein